MEIVSPLVSPEVRGLQGLHLYHYGMSNCSQKVRICLQEKGIAWIDHHVDLRKNEHVTPEYLDVNAKGVVPALVHDGLIVVESSDIMEYLDEYFPDPPLRPEGDAARRAMRLWVARQDSIQHALRILSHEFLFRRAARKTEDELRRYEALLTDHELVAFHREFSSARGLARSTIAGAVRVADEALVELNRHLYGREWIIGNRFTLADIAWVVDVHRFVLMRFPTRQYGALRVWYRRVRARPSFQRAVRAYEPREVRRSFGLHRLGRWLLRRHAGAARWRNPRLLADS